MGRGRSVGVLTTTDGAGLADALFGGPASTRHGLHAARRALAAAEIRLAEHDAEEAARPDPWIAADPLALSVWRDSFTPAHRARLVASVERCRSAIASLQDRLTRFRGERRAA